ncbi:uncharacterized protein [Montipora foliosa]|uniref:uncharacterized protein isoform X1 n=1 Tax=Montipora foliosa TaxID=591990 RepID=UPI0035F1EBF6
MTRLNLAVIFWCLWFARVTHSKGQHGPNANGNGGSNAHGQPEMENSKSVRSTTSPSIHPAPKCVGQNVFFPISGLPVIDRKVLGHVIWTQSVLSEIQCEDQCLRFPDCSGYNYQYSGRTGQKACELMSEIGVNLTFSKGYVFRGFERKKFQRTLLGSQQCDD